MQPNLEQVASELESIGLEGMDESELKAFGLVDSEKASSDGLRVDGVFLSNPEDELYGVKCIVCETLIHIPMAQAGQRVECPDCFVKIQIPDARELKRRRPDRMALQAPKNPTPSPSEPASEELGELKLSEPVQRPPSGVPVGYGLDDVERDMLKPKTKADEPVTPEVIDPSHVEVEDLKLEPVSTQVPSSLESATTSEPVAESRQADHSRKTNSDGRIPAPNAAETKRDKTREEIRKSRREKLEASEAEFDGGGLFETNASELDMTPFSAESLYSRIFESLFTWGTLIRAAIATAILFLSTTFFQIGESYRLSEEKLDGGQWMAMGGNYSVFFITWIVGMILLLHVASMLFRDNAQGEKKVKRWGAAGFEDLKSTFLIFSVSYAIAASPMLGIWLRTGIPLGTGFSFLIAPLLLLGAWYNRSVFMVIAIDAFSGMARHLQDWQWLYTFLVLLGIMNILGGFTYLFNFWFLNLIGTCLQVFSLLAFAAITGWHVGRTVTRLENEA